jgi:hypothetical protein
MFQSILDKSPAVPLELSNVGNNVSAPVMGKSKFKSFLQVKATNVSIYP